MPQCGPPPCAPTTLPPLPPAPAPAQEIYNQNNGQPVIVYAYSDAANELVPSPVPSAPALPLPLPPALALPLPPALAPAPIVAPVEPEPTDLETAQQIADQSIADQPLETIPAPETPCKVETSTEIVHTPGETFVHQPGEILINQPPTRLIINHAPYIVRPSPVILNQGSKTITNAYTRKTLPSSIQLRPVIVRIVRPIEKKVLIDKPQQPGCQNYVSNPPIPDQCAYADVPAAALPVPALVPADSLDISALLSQANVVIFH